MRSNSNEFLDSPMQLLGSRQKDLSDTDTILSDDSDYMVLEGHHTILVSSVGSQFEIVVKSSNEHIDKMIKNIKLAVWPCFRMPHGGSAISLINNSFLFGTRHRQEECIETEFLVGLSLISARKFIQASEKFRSIE